MADGKEGQDVRVDGGAPDSGAGAGGGEDTTTRTQPQGDGNGSDAGNGNSGEGSGDGAGNDQGGSGSGEGQGDDERLNPRTGKPWTLDEMSQRFRESAAGARDLLKDKQTLTKERDDAVGKIAQLEKDMADLRAIAEGKNPEGLKAADVQAQLTQTSQELALLKESASLDAFEKGEPLATGALRESLKSLARANPKESLKDLWDANLKAGAEAAAAKKKADDEARKKGQGDQGKGTSTREPASGGNTVSGTKGDTGLSLEEFNALPVVKRKALMEKYGIS